MKMRRNCDQFSRPSRVNFLKLSRPLVDERVISLFFETLDPEYQADFLRDYLFLIILARSYAYSLDGERGLFFHNYFRSFFSEYLHMSFNSGYQLELDYETGALEEKFLLGPIQPVSILLRLSDLSFDELLSTKGHLLTK